MTQTVGGQPGHDRFQPDRDERRDHDEQERLLQGHHGLAQRDGQQRADGDREAGPEQAAPIQRLPRDPERLLLTHLCRDLLRLSVQQQRVGRQRRRRRRFRSGRRFRRGRVSLRGRVSRFAGG